MLNKLLKLSPIAISIALAVSNHAVAATTDSDIEVIKVSADFRNHDLLTLPASATIIDQQQLEDEGAQHFEDVLNSIANFNWSGATSRPRYFQIRGVGEQEDYQGAPNSSVGYVIDDIDLSGLGMVSSMYDLQQVEVLRGPQGTRYGANALAGLIYLKSNDPTDVFEHGAQLSVGNDDLRTFSGFSSGPLTDSGKLLYRVSLQQHNQNGFRDNVFLNRDDTNKRDEFSGRTKLRWLATDDITADLTILHANFNNGYDAWTLDNNGFKTQSDKPGKDSQRTTGSSLKLNFAGDSRFDVTSITSYSNTNHLHSYDTDWANPKYWQSRKCGDKPCEYNATFSKNGKRKNISQEIRLSSKEAGRIFNESTDWLVGIYTMNLQEDNDRDGTFEGKLTSDFEATNIALFGQLDTQLGDGYELSTGLRLERRNSEYSDSKKDHFKPSENMWGGHIALNKAIDVNHNAYARIARGYKAGGFNLELPKELADKKQFDTEVLYNYEIGLKSLWLNRRLSTNASVFFMDRQNQQVKHSRQLANKSFEFFTENAGNSKNYGVELETKWQPTDNLNIYASLGYLKAQYGNYKYNKGKNKVIDLTGRDLAHAPHFTNSFGATYRADNGFFTNVNSSGKSKFFYSDSNDSQSRGYQILNARIGYEQDSWSVYLWGSNLTNKKYGVRGFFFGNEPDQDWKPKQYIRFADPRQFGLTTNIKF